MKRNSRNKFMIDLVLRNDTPEISVGMDESETYKENINNTNNLSNIDDAPASTSFKQFSLQNNNLDDAVGVHEDEYFINKDGPVEPSNEDDFIENSDDRVKDPDFSIGRGMLRRRFFCNSQAEINDNLPPKSINILQEELQFNSEKNPNYVSDSFSSSSSSPSSSSSSSSSSASGSSTSRSNSAILPASKRRLKSGPIYVPSQYAEVIRSAKKKGRPYNLTEMSSCDFVSLKTLAQDMGIQTKSFKILDVKMLKITKDAPTTLFYNTSFNQTEFLTAELSRKKNLGEINLKPAYKTKPKIKPNKINDLLSLVESNHIPKFYESFYRSLNNN